MGPKEPTRHQLSSRLQYQSHTPAFLQRFQDKVRGAPDEDEDEPAQYYDDGSGRPPIPLRPAIPERPSDDPGSADEDDADEKPQVVVLKAGKHLTEREAENERRKEKGLPPLPVSDDDQHGEEQPQTTTASTKSKPKAPSLSFSSAKGQSSGSSSKLKRRIVTEDDGSGSEPDKVKKAPKKKTKREGKSLLSFGEDV